MKRKQHGAPKLSLKKTAIAALHTEAAQQVQGGLTVTHCVQPTTTVQPTYVCSIRMVCLTTQTFNCTTE